MKNITIMAFDKLKIKIDLISSEHYPMVGGCLIEALKDVLGSAATDDVINAWKEGYNYLASILIKLEQEARKENARKPGWVM